MTDIPDLIRREKALAQEYVEIAEHIKQYWARNDKSKGPRHAAASIRTGLDKIRTAKVHEDHLREDILKVQDDEITPDQKEEVQKLWNLIRLEAFNCKAQFGAIGIVF